MKEKKLKYPQGTLLLEALVAIGTAAAFMSALVGFLVVANRGSDRAIEIQRALWSANEGVEALRAISFTSLTNTLTGAITFSTPNWTLATNGPETLPSGATRVVKVEDVYRDSNCDVTTTGGTVDIDSKKITSETSWTDSADRTHTITTTTLRTNWEDPQGDCFSATQAGQVSFAVDDSQFYGGKQLRELYFTNTGGTAVTIDKINFTWSNGAKLDQLFLDSSKVWSSTGPGTPVGTPISSGTELDIANFTMTPGQTSEITKGQFDIPMSGASMTMTVTFADGSVFTSEPFTPR